MNNPYEAPKAALEAPDFDEVMRRDLRVIGEMQKVIILCIAANFGLFAMAFALSSTSMVGIVRVAALALTVAEVWAVARLASKLFGKGIAVFATLGMFVPCFSLFVLILVNGAATKRLQAAGMHVGLLGVDVGKLP